MDEREAWKRWVEKRVRETTYRPDEDGRDRFLFESGFRAAMDSAGKTADYEGPSEDDLTSDHDYEKWRESWRNAYGYYPNQATTLKEYLDALP